MHSSQRSAHPRHHGIRVIYWLFLVYKRRQAINEPDEYTMQIQLRALCMNPDATPQAIDELLKTGLNTNVKAKDEDSKTPLMVAAVYNRPAIVEALLKAGADIEAGSRCDRSRNSIGKTPLMYAAGYNPNPEVVELLVKSGADIEARTKYNGQTPLMFAARWSPSPTVIEVLLKAGANAKVKDKDGKTALDYAKGNENIYKTEVYRTLSQAACG